MTNNICPVRLCINLKAEIDLRLKAVLLERQQAECEAILQSLAAMLIRAGYIGAVERPNTKN